MKTKPLSNLRNRIVTTLLLTAFLMLASILASPAIDSAAAMPIATLPTLDPRAIPKWTNQLVIPPVYVPTNVTDENGNVIRQEYTVDATQFYQQILPTVDEKGRPTGFGLTKVWGYGGITKDARTGQFLGYIRHSPAASFEAIRSIPIQVKWVNNLVDASGDPLPHLFLVDPTLHWANPNDMMMPMYPVDAPPAGYPEAQSPVPIVTHLHGGEVASYFDGGPDEWFTPDGIHGDGYSTFIPTDPNAAVYFYNNTQQPATLWYHDHALGMTRLNVMAGLAGFYLLREYNTTIDSVAPLLPSGKYEVPVAIQDRSFNLDGSFWFPTAGLNPLYHPYWQPEFFGNTIMVNGKVWPNLNVDNGQYRLRLLDGSTARFYTISFVDRKTKAMLPFIQIGTDGGYLKAPVTLTSLTIAPGERADILIDFSGLPAGTQILMRNTAKAPFPSGTPPDGSTTGQIMQFTVTGNPGFTPLILPAALNPTLLDPFPTLPATTSARTLILFEVMGPLGPLEILLNGQKWAGNISELPRVGSTEDWYIVNPTADTHPIHLHLVQFQLVSRQAIDTKNYMAQWTAINGMPPLPLDMTPTSVDITPYLKGKAMPTPPNEQGWKDTVRMNPGEVTRIRVRWAPQDAPTVGSGASYPGLNLYPFDPTIGPGYVWHCHIIDHEDNEMMRPYKVTW